ncbi:flavin reductase family protein [Acrocarpospora macrocephala]|nr:flavin reductase family protein [Acrocarpospora macrocephala]
MANVAAAVSVVTVLTEGDAHGTTVSAFMSLSMTPPMMLVSLDSKSDLLSRLRVGSTLGINVLASHQDQIARRFAQKGVRRFEGVAWTIEDGAPALSERQAWVAVSVTRFVIAGDHTLVLGAVNAADATEEAPLTYWQRTFGSHRRS